MWHTRTTDRTAALELDLAVLREKIGGMTCRMPLAAQLGTGEGAPVALEVSMSRDRVYWSVAEGTLSPAREDGDGQLVFGRSLSGRYARIRVLSSTRGSAAVVPELGFRLADGKAVRLHL